MLLLSFVNFFKRIFQEYYLRVSNGLDPDLDPHSVGPSDLGPNNKSHKEKEWESRGSVVESLTRDSGVAGSSLTGIIMLCS